MATDRNRGLVPIDPADIEVRSKRSSVLLALAFGIAVGLFVALLFGAVKVTTHDVIDSNHVATVHQRNFSRELTCQIINGESKANAQTLIAEVPGLSAARQAQMRRGYELRVTHDIEHNLGLTGRVLINADGSLNCSEYVLLGARSSPVTAR